MPFWKKESPNFKVNKGDPEEKLAGGVRLHCLESKLLLLVAAVLQLISHICFLIAGNKRIYRALQATLSFLRGAKVG